MNKELIEKLKKLAQKKVLGEGEEDFNPMDASGGNFDDAYDMGIDDGEIWLAREILNKMGVKYE